MRNGAITLVRTMIAKHKTASFAIFGGLGAFVGSVIGYQVGGDGNIIKIAVWDAFIGVGIGVAIAWMQNSYLRRTEVGTKEVIRMALRCAIGGAAGGASLVLVKSALGGGWGAHIAGWTTEGLIMGGILAPVFPNLPRQFALIAGALGGFIGAILGSLVGPLFGTTIGVALADSLKGVFLGIMLTITEKIQLISEASLTVHWAKNETSKVLLGKEPIRIGSDPSCQIYLRNNQTPEIPVVAEIVLNKGKIILHDNRNGQDSDLVDGTMITVGGLRIQVRAAGSKQKVGLAL